MIDACHGIINRKVCQKMEIRLEIEPASNYWAIKRAKGNKMSMAKMKMLR